MDGKGNHHASLLLTMVIIVTMAFGIYHTHYKVDTNQAMHTFHKAG